MSRAMSTWPLFVGWFAIIGAGLLGWFWAEGDPVVVANILILGVTAGVAVWYAFETRRMVSSSQELTAKTEELAQETRRMANKTAKMADETQKLAKTAAAELEVMKEEADQRAMAYVHVNVLWSHNSGEPRAKLTIWNVGPATAHFIQMHGWLATDEHDSSLAYDSDRCAMLPPGQSYEATQLAFEGESFRRSVMHRPRFKLLVTWLDEKRRPWASIREDVYNGAPGASGTLTHWPSETDAEMLRRQDKLFTPEVTQSERYERVKFCLSPEGQALKRTFAESQED